MNLKSTLHQKTHRPDFLWTTSIGILVVGLILGVIVSFIPRPPVSTGESIWSAMRAGTMASMQPSKISILVGPRVPQEFQLVALARVASARKDSDEWQAGLAQLPETRRPLTMALIDSVMRGNPTAKLSEMLEETPPPPMAHHALGAFYWTNGQFGLAAEQFEIEGSRKDASLSREYALDSYEMAEDEDSIERLQNDPRYQRPPTIHDRILTARANRDFGAIFRLSFESLFETLTWSGSAALALIAGLGWFVIALQMGQVNQDHGPRLWLVMLAIVMGGLSIGVTHFLDIWQQMDWDLHESNESFEGIRFYVLGVGLREEVAKLLLLLPLIPWMIHRKSEMEVLIVSASVGLGFAIVENINYFEITIGTSSVGRFLTANFAHMAMTGLIGLSVARAIWSRDALGQSLLTILLIVIVHGLYDATITVDVFEQMRIATMIIFVLLAYAFFRELRQTYRPKRETISLAATFLWTLTFLTAVTFVYVSWLVGYQVAGQSLSSDIAGMGVLIVMYLREIPNSLVDRS